MNTIRTFRNALESFDSELLSPFTVGFDRTFDRLWDYANHNNSTTNYPPYNVKKKHENNKFVIEMALAGFSRSDLDIEVSDGILTISSSITQLEMKLTLTHYITESLNDNLQNVLV